MRFKNLQEYCNVCYKNPNDITDEEMEAIKEFEKD